VSLFEQLAHRAFTGSSDHLQALPGVVASGGLPMQGLNSMLMPELRGSSSPEVVPCTSAGLASLFNPCGLDFTHEDMVAAIYLRPRAEAAQGGGHDPTPPFH